MANLIYRTQLILKIKIQNLININAIKKEKIMKYVKFLSAILLPCYLLYSCGSNTNANSGKENTSATSSNTSASTGSANWSCVIDGQPVSGGKISSYFGPEGYQSNEAHIVDVDQGKELLIYLADPKSATSQGVHSLRLAVPDKTGNSSFGPDEDGWGIEVDILVNDKHTAIYNSDSFTINVTSLSASRVSGTFSGKFKFHGNIDDKDKNEIEVTDGKFDIPMSNP